MRRPRSRAAEGQPSWFSRLDLPILPGIRRGGRRMQQSNQVEAGSVPEELFVELFAQAFGQEKLSLLSQNHPVVDIDGGGRFIDFALRARGEKIAFEIDGLP